MERLVKKRPEPQLFDFSEITEEQFWDEAESKVVERMTPATRPTAASYGGNRACQGRPLDDDLTCASAVSMPKDLRGLRSRIYAIC